MPIVEIEALTMGPFGVGHLDGKAVMVAHAAPGDLLEVAIESEHRDYAAARTVRIVKPGSARRRPPCPFLPRCGGCDWQQIQYREQVRLKARMIARELGRALDVELDVENLVEPAPAEFGYRSRIRLKCGPRGELGFREFGGKTLVEIDRCMVADDLLELPIQLAGAMRGRAAEIEIVRSGARQVIVADLIRPPGPKQIAAARVAMQADPHIAGIVMRAAQTREVLGNPIVALEPEPGLRLEVPADAFSQVNPEQNRKLVAFVMAAAEPLDDTELLDLFCGVGNLSLSAARRGARVLGVDSDPIAIRAAQDNAARLDFRKARFSAMRAAETARFLTRVRYKPDVVILDPPRTGARELIDPIARLRPAGLIYVSCDLASLGRDLRALRERGYQLERVRGFDFFPNTHHIETVVHMVLT